MTTIKVLSSTQKIIVEQGGSVSVVNAGPPGPVGPAGANGDLHEVISGTINVDNTVWVMQHNLDIDGPLDLNPAVWWFEDQNGVPMEPVSVDFSTSNIALATWLEPVRGVWRLTP